MAKDDLSTADVAYLSKLSLAYFVGAGKVTAKLPSGKEITARQWRDLCKKYLK